MKKSNIFFLLLAGIVLVNSCTYFSKKEEASCSADQMINPNGESELALLMRDMAKHATALSKAMKEGGEVGVYPKDFERIKTAKPTDEDKHTPLFFAGADLYLSALKKFYEGEADKRKIHFDDLLNTCKSCHENFCPGPLKKIESLRVPLSP